MKLIPLAFVVISVFVAGCISTPERRAAHQLASYSPRGAHGEVIAGCYGYFARTGRWPQTADDLRAGLKEIDRAPEHVQSMRELTLAVSGGALSVYFVSKDGTRGDMKLEPPKPEKPNKAPEPTPGIARFSQGSEVFDLVAGVAHL